MIRVYYSPRAPLAPSHSVFENTKIATVYEPGKCSMKFVAIESVIFCSLEIISRAVGKLIYCGMKITFQTKNIVALKRTSI